MLESVPWLVVGPALGATWLTGELAEGGKLGALLCEVVTLDEELGAEFVEMLGGALGAGLGAGLGAAVGGGLLGVLDS